MTEVYTASTVLDIVDAVPTLFGFTPHESFIGITTSGPVPAGLFLSARR